MPLKEPDGSALVSVVVRTRETSSDRSPALLAYTAVAVAAALWALAAVVARRLFDEGVRPVELTESRAVLAAVGFALVPSSWRRPTSGRPVVVTALGVALALVNATYYVSVSRIPVAVALVIQYTAPALIVGWMSLAARRPPGREVTVALVAALIGVVAVLDVPGGVSGGVDGPGMAAAIASAFFFASYIVLAERASAAYGSAGAMFRGFVVATALWIVFQTASGGGVPRELFEPGNLPEVLYVGLAGTLAPFLLFAWGLQRVRAERASIVATLEPVVAALVAWGWLGQSLGAVQVAGGIMVVTAVASLQLRRTQPVPIQSA